MPLPDKPVKQSYTLLYGLNIREKEIRVTDNITLRRIDEKMNLFDIIGLVASGFRESLLLELLSGGCNTELIYTSKSEADHLNVHLGIAWTSMVLIHLRGFHKSMGVTVSTQSWADISGHDARKGKPIEIYSDFGAQLLDFHISFLKSSKGNRILFTKNDAKWIEDRMENSLKLWEEASFRLAFIACQDWRYAKDRRIAITRIWSGIEAIMGVNMELKFRISSLVASLLEPRGKRRLKKYRKVQKLYDIRSRVVHGDNKLRESKISEVLEASYDLLRSLVLLEIERGHVFTKSDFENALFS